MSKHTAGPWTVKPSGDIETSDGELIMPPGVSAQDIRTNAALIAAAPDLLEALQWIVEFAHEHQEWFDGYHDDSAENLWLENAVAAIQKATGKQG